MSFNGVESLLNEAGLGTAPEAKAAVFVGNAWDPSPGRETPWIDLARQIADDAGVEALGAAAITTPPGTEAIGRVFAAANAPVVFGGGREAEHAFGQYRRNQHDEPAQ